jgi:hypothetical protein
MRTYKILAVLGLVIGVSFTALLAGPASAQYGSGGTGGGSSTGVYTPPQGGYSSKTGIGIGVGAAAGAGVIYLALRHRGSVTGCVGQADDGLTLVDAKTKRTYSLMLDGPTLKSGQQVVLKGKKLKDAAGTQVFEAKKMVKDLGACSP